MIHFKICMIGAYSVGKTSLVDRYIRSLYSEKYLTTIGVKIDKKVLHVNATDVTCMLWDIAGEDEFYTVNNSYLRGMSGYFMVLDGTRRVTLEMARRIQHRIEVLFPETPFVLIANKADLNTEWTLNNEDLEGFSAWPYSSICTSAKTGNNVEAAFTMLVEKMLSKQKLESTCQI